jgi:hypothetical protein
MTELFIESFEGTSMFPLFDFAQTRHLVLEHFLRFHFLYTENNLTVEDFGVHTHTDFETSYFIDQSTCPGLQALQGINK